MFGEGVSQRTNSGVVLQEPSTLVFEKGSLNWEFAKQAGLSWLAREPKDLPVSASPVLGSHACSHAYFLKLGLELRCLCLQGEHITG